MTMREKKIKRISIFLYNSNLYWKPVVSTFLKRSDLQFFFNLFQFFITNLHKLNVLTVVKYNCL